jgi:hypothetical protein
MSEAEATAIRFTIDHYESKYARPDLVNEYTNLMYACDECNLRKGDRSPPPAARADGFRFFRPDHDRYPEHFRLNGLRLEGQTHTGEYSIEAIDLNRRSLRKLRHIRQRLTDCDKLITAGVLALREFHIDQLPSHVKGSAAATIAKAITVANRMANDIDALLREHARSSLIDPDPESEKRAADRAAKLDTWKGLYPGSWRAPKAVATTSRRGRK